MLDDEATEEIDDCQEEIEPEVPFDYRSLPPETVRELEAAVPILRQRFKKLDNDARALGDYLIGLKKKAGHGLFLRWLQAKLPGPKGAKRAQRLMRLAGYCQEYAIACANLSGPTLNILIRTKEETARQVLERAEQRGVPLTDDEARDELPAPLGRKGKVPKEKTEKAQPAAVQTLGSVTSDPQPVAQEDAGHQAPQDPSIPTASEAPSFFDTILAAKPSVSTDSGGIGKIMAVMQTFSAADIATIIEVLKEAESYKMPLDMLVMMLEARFRNYLGLEPDENAA
jgi:hypothetical protein